MHGILNEDTLGTFLLPAGGVPFFRAHKIRLRNIRVFEDTGEIILRPSDTTNADNVILLLGDNAAGKSTILKCLALAFLGVDLANVVEQRAGSYIRYGADRGWIEVVFQLYTHANTEEVGEYCIGLEIRTGETGFRMMQNSDLTLGKYNVVPRLNIIRRRTDDNFGFFCGYGSLRILSDNLITLLPEEQRDSVERVVSLFRPAASLMDPDVLSRMLSGDVSIFRNAPATRLSADLCSKMLSHLGDVFSGILENGSVGSANLVMHRAPISFRDLSDGYNSILALVGHLFRHALAFGKWSDDPSLVSGCLLVDEIDLHLHPAWQRRILRDLSKVFPNLQIITTSHSAMVAGSIDTDAITVLRRQGDEVVPSTPTQSISEMRADQILTSELFDLATTRNIDTEQLFNEYAEMLNESGPDHPAVKELGKRVSEAMNMVGEGTVDEVTHLLLQKILEQQFMSLDEPTRKLVLAKAELALSEARGRK